MKITKKFSLAVLILALILSGCSAPQESDEPVTETEQTTQKYKLVEQGEETTPTYLELMGDGKFTMDFNICHFMAKGEGEYVVDSDGNYELTVNSCTNCDNNEYNNSVGNDYGLSTVKMELEPVSDTELQLTSKLTRTQDDQELGFCVNLADGENGTFQLVK